MLSAALCLCLLGATRLVVTTQAERETLIDGMGLKLEMRSWKVRVPVRDGTGVSGISGGCYELRGQK